MVSVLIAAHNEDNVMNQKLINLLNSIYPTHKLEILIGSDASTDHTNLIVQRFARHHKNIRFFLFEERQGKARIVEQLVNQSIGEIIIITDANVFLERNTIFDLVKHFKNNEIGLVDSHMINKGLNKNGISIQESIYISREVKIKNSEARIWGTMMGPFGGCFAMRKELFVPVPQNFTVDDFYWNMKVLEKGFQSINELQAIVYEDVSNLISEEFRRKVRISVGNFQNTIMFKHLLNGFFTSKNLKHKNPFGLALCFLSHKIFRWITPFLIILIVCVNILLIHSLFYEFTLKVFLGTIILTFIDILFRKIGIHIVTLRFVTHFYSMNLALFIGFLKFLKGVKTNVWQPTRRNQAT